MMTLTKKSLMTGMLFLLLFFWQISFGYFDGLLNSDTGARVAGNYVIVNLAAAALLVICFPSKIRFNFPGVTVFAVLITWLFLIHFVQPDYFTSIKKFSIILLTQLLLIMLANYAWKVSFFKLVDLLLIYLGIMMALAIWVHVTKVGPIGIGTHVEQFRLGGTFTFGQTATLAGLGFLFSVYQLLFKPDGSRLFYFIGLGFFGYCLVGADLRTAIGACMAAVLVQYLMYLKSRNKSIFPVLILVSVLYGAYKLYLAINPVGSEVSKDFEYRQQIWAMCFPGILARPILGYGNLSLFFVNNVKVHQFNGELADPHSSYFALMLQSGMVTFLLFLLFLYKVVRSLLVRTAYFSKALISVFVFWLIVGSTGGFMFDLDYEITSVMFMFSLLAFCCHPIHREYYEAQVLERGRVNAYL